MVAPHVGAWIETAAHQNYFVDQMSHPMWVRGLKQPCGKCDICKSLVAPHVGAWIETVRDMRIAESLQVAPHVGAWIETRATIW